MRLHRRCSSPFALAWLLGVTVAVAGLPTVRCAAESTPDDATRAAARQLGEQGIEAYRAEDYKAAEQTLDRAYQLFAVPTLGLWSARVRARLGHLVEAAERYRDTHARRAPSATVPRSRRRSRPRPKSCVFCCPGLPA
jgi:hypothetical protein